MTTKVLRIDLSKAANDLEKKIEQLSDNQGFNKFKLAGCFVYGTDLVLIFQKET